MSHNKERKEKICLNCNAEIFGRYCHVCGQENIEPKETFWHLANHFVNDVTHFDGKFFSTVKYLLMKPGFLPKEYIKGRRMRYLNPIRMYVFTSAIFFIFFFSVIKPEESLKVNANNGKKYSYRSVKSDLENGKNVLERELKNNDLPASTKSILEDRLAIINADLQRLQKDTTHLEELNTIKDQSLDAKYKTVKEYDSAQNSLPPDKRDNWYLNKFRHREISLKQKYKNNFKDFANDLLHKFLHSIPQLLFVSLPLVALILQLLYVRRKSFFYVDHVIYLVHLYCAMFILLFFQLSFAALKSFSILHWLGYINIAVSIYMLWYVYKSMRNFYMQRRGKTILKFSLLMVMSSVLMCLLFLVYFIMSVFTV